jgi:hypothetical protein
MRILLAIVLALALGWSGYWYVGANALERSFADWFVLRRAEGWQADYASLTTRGFPNRFDTTAMGLVLADPGTGWKWTTPFFQILALSYNPRHLIAIWPHAHTLRTPDQTIEIKSEDMRGSVVFSSIRKLALSRSQFVVRDPVLTSDAGWTMAARELRFATRQDADVDFGMEIGLTAFDLSPGGSFARLVAPLDLPPKLSDFRLDATLGLSKALDKSAFGDAPPQPRALNIRTARAVWGDLLFQASGRLTIDDKGEPTGAISVQLRNWRRMLDLLGAAGLLSDRNRPATEGTLEMLAGISGDPDFIDVTLNFRAGFVSVGMIPIAPAPRLVF